MKTKNKTAKILLFTILIVLILINSYFILAHFNVFKNKNVISENEKLIAQNSKDPIVKELNLTYDPLSLKGFTKVFVSVKGTDLILENNCTSLTVMTNEYQAYSIEQGIKSRIDIRPTTHDLMTSILTDFNITLLQAKIIANKDQHFYARTIYKQGNRIMDIDAKASDAAALAVRLNVPVYVENKLFYSKGTNVCKTK